MAEPDIKVLVGVDGGGEIDGKSGKQILKDLQNVAKEISNNKKLEVAINVNVEKTTDNFKKQLENALKHVKLNASTIIDVDDGKKRIATFGASVQSAIDSMAKDVIKRSEAVKKSLDTMTDGDFSTFKDSLASIQKESEKLVASVDKIDTMADLSNILDQFDALEKRIRNIQKAAGHKSAAFVSVDGILNFADSIDGKNIGSVQDRVAEVRTEVATLVQTLNVTDDTTIIDSVTQRLHVLGEELVKLRSQANNSFDFDTEIGKLTVSAENAIRKLSVLRKNDTLGDNSDLFNNIERQIRGALSGIDKAGSAEVFENIAAAVRSAISQVDDIAKKINFDHLSDTGFAAFNQQLGNAKNLLDQISSSKYDNAIDIIGAEENAELQKAITLISQLSTKHAGGASFNDLDEYRNELDALVEAINKVRNTKKTLDTSLKNTGWALQERQNFNVLTNSVQRYYDTYKDNISKIPSLNTSFTSLLSKLEIPSNFKGGIKEARIEFSNLRREFQLTGGESQTLMQRLQALFGTRLGSAAIGAAVMTLQNGLRQTVKHVVDINTSMTELRKVSNSSADALGEFFDRTREKAVDLSTEITTLIDATANFSRLGYGLQEAETLGEWATILANVADGMNSIDDATNSMISTMAAFGIEADKANEVVDKFNKIGNEYPISTAGAAEALKRSASSLSEASNTIDESLALIATANSVVQNPESVGTTLKTLSLRMRSAKVELEEAGEESEGAAESVADLRKEILALTNQRVDIMIDDDTFKSTYKMLEEISAVWNEINDVDRAALLELIAGKRNANVAAAIINNFDMAKEALEDSIDAEGSAMREYEVWMDSIQAKTQQFTAQFQSLSGVLVEQEWIKDVVDMGTGLLKLLTDLVEATGSIPLILSAFASFATLKNVGFINVIPDFDKDGYKFNTTDFFKKVSDAFKRDVKDVTFKDVGSDIRDNFISSIFGVTPLKATKLGETQKELFNSIATGFKNIDISNDDVVNKYFSNVFTKNSDLSKNTTEALKEYFRTVKDGSFDFEKANQFIDQYNQSLINNQVNAKKAALKANLIAGAWNIGISIAIAGAVKAIDWFINRHDDAIKKANELTEVYQENTKEIKKNIDSIEGIRSEFEYLSRGVDGSGKNISLSNEEFERYCDLVSQITEISPELIIGYDAEGAAIIRKNGAIDETIKKLKEQLELERATLVASQDDIIDGRVNKYNDYLDDSENREKRNKAVTLLRSLENAYAQYIPQWDSEINSGNAVIADRAREAKKRFMQSYKKLKAQYESEIRGYDVLIAADIQSAEALVKEHYNTLGRAILEGYDTYANVLTEGERQIVDVIASNINGLEDNGDHYVADLINLVDVVSALSDESIQAVSDMFAANGDMPYKQYIETLKKGLANIPENLRPVVEIALGFDMDNPEDLLERVRNSLLSKGLAASNVMNLDATGLLGSLNKNDLEVMLHPDFVLSSDDDTWFEIRNKIDVFLEAHPELNAEIPVKIDVASRIEGVEEIKKAYDTLSGTVEEYNTSGTVSVDTLIELTSVSDEYIGCLEFTESGLRLNAEAMNALTKAKVMEMAISKIQSIIDEGESRFELTEAIDAETGAIEAETGAINALTEAKIRDMAVGWSETNKDALVKSLEGYVATVNAILSQIDTLGTDNSSGSTDPWKDEFESYLSELEFMRDTNRITEQQYYAELNRLNEKYFANNKKYLDDYRKYYVEVYDYLLKRQEDMLNAIADAAQKALDKQLEAKDKEIDARQELIDAKREELNALEEQYEKEDRLFELQKARDNYNKIAANKNTRLYTRDKGWIYTADPHALQEAKDKLDELEKENERAEAKEAIEDEIKALEDEIKVIEKEKEAIEALKDKWGEATDNIGKSLEEYMIDLQLTTAFTKMSYEQMSAAVLQYTALTQAAMSGKLIGNGFAGFGNFYGNTVNPFTTLGSYPVVNTLQDDDTGALNVIDDGGETNRPTGAGGLTGIAALRESNIAGKKNKDAEKLLESEEDTKKNTGNIYDANIQLIRWEEDAYAMTENAFAEQYEISNMTYSTLMEELGYSMSTDENVAIIAEFFDQMMQEGGMAGVLMALMGGGLGGGGGFGGLGGGNGSDDSESSGGSGKSRHGKISYADMNEEQRARAQRMADRFGLDVEDIRMYDVGDNGLIIVGQDQLTTEEQQMVSKGWADTIHDITDEMRKEYRRPWTEEELRAQEAAKIVMGSRARGSMSIGRSGLYNVDEQGLETIVHPENGRVTWLEQGDRVYTAPDTKRNYDMTDLFAKVETLEAIKRLTFDNPMENIVSSLSQMPRTNPIQAIPVNQTVERDSDIYISGCEFNMPNVTDRESFIKDLTRIAKYK